MCSSSLSYIIFEIGFSFTTVFKTAIFKPLLKKENTDSSVISNYGPISNLPFLSKIVLKIVMKRLNDFLLDNDVFEKFQSGFGAQHSTETALVKVVNDLRMNTDQKKLSVLVLLDLSAAFDTIDHNILLDRLENWVGLSDTVFKWFGSYLTGRQLYGAMGDRTSEKMDLTYGVQQGSVLGPVLLSLYMLTLSNIIRNPNINFHNYADDTQLYISVSSNDYSSIDKLITCISDISL